MTLELFQILLLYLKQILTGENIPIFSFLLLGLCLFADESKIPVQITYCSTVSLSEVINHIEGFQQKLG